MGKSCTPVGAAQCCREIAPVPYRHGGEHPAGAAVHPAAQGGAEPFLQTLCPGTEAFARYQRGKISQIGPLQGNAVGTAVYPVPLCRRGQLYPAAHPLPRLTVRQTGAYHPEVGGAAVDLFQMEHSIHCIGQIAFCGFFHLCHHGQGASGILHPDLFQPGVGGVHRSGSGGGTQQQAQPRPPGAFPSKKQQTKGNKKCRKRHKKFRLRQKSAH